MKSTREKHADVRSIKTYATVITAQPGQWFCSTKGRWELWDNCAGTDVLVRRILHKNVLSVERKLTPHKKFVREQIVVLRLPANAEHKERTAGGRVTGVNPDSTIMTIHVPIPPEWMFGLLRARGIFQNGPVTLQVFLDHKGTWTDIHGFNHFAIT